MVCATVKKLQNYLAGNNLFVVSNT
ncbi:hypothetical protein Dpoa2040_000444 [Dickeya sp. CFBP 2040]|nr:hypothetical protein [Dickeya sp. CFBP 2040]